MKKIIFLLCLVFVVSAASAADNYRVLTIQILKPVKQPVNFIGRSPAIYAALYVTGNEESGYSYLNDSLTAGEIAIGIKDALEEAEDLAAYDIPVYNFYSFCTDGQCDSISRITDDDLLILVKNAAVTLYQSVKRQYTDYNSVYFKVGTYAAYTATFELYDAVNNEVSHREVLSDTLVWEINADDADAAFQELPTLEEAQQLAANEIGRLYAHKLSPYWRPAKRFLFELSGKELSAAADYAENYEWDKAMQIWEQYVGNRNARTAAQAAFNMALGCEMNGLYELAMEWLAYAAKLYSIEEIAGYRAVLQKRINESNVLQKQLQDLEK
jgi:hypothetical protein